MNAAKAKKPPKEKRKSYLCYICGKEILNDDFVYIETRRKTKIYIHGACMPHWRK